ncbi:MAG: rod shape-determining protein, partial [Candidatus Poribacteria bacterium]|nr:rod shape-determining protein [Candidatus Poribacteria bacterium]
WHITNDLAMMLRLTSTEAEELKRNHGCAVMELVEGTETVPVKTRGSSKTQMMHRQTVAEIIQPRVVEIFELVTNELDKSHHMLPGGIVLTGGTALLEGIQELAEQMFDMPVRIGYPRELRGLSDRVHSPIHATGVGLLLYGTRERWSGKGTQRFIKGNVFDNLFKRMSSWYSYLKEDYF